MYVIYPIASDRSTMGVNIVVALRGESMHNVSKPLALKNSTNCRHTTCGGVPTQSTAHLFREFVHLDCHRGWKLLSPFYSITHSTNCILSKFFYESSYFAPIVLHLDVANEFPMMPCNTFSVL